MASQTPTTKYHPYYGDPAADIVLRPSFGAAYRVHSWYLAQQSETFKIIRAKKEFTSMKYPPVDTHLDPSLLDIFLAFVHTHPQPTAHSLPSPLSLEHLVALYTFAKTFECHGFRKVLLGHMDRNSPADLLALLKKADATDDIQLAKAIIARLGYREIRSIGFWVVVDALQDEWKMPFIRAMLPEYEIADIVDPDSDSRSRAFNPSLKRKPTSKLVGAPFAKRKRLTEEEVLTELGYEDATDADEDDNDATVGDEVARDKSAIEKQAHDDDKEDEHGHVSYDSCECPECSFGPTDEEDEGL